MLIKKGQSASGAAALIAAIAGLIILYIMFLPPGDRDDLLGLNASTQGTVKGVAEDARTLLKESPGTVFKSKQDEFEHRINSFNLFEKSEDRVLKSFQSLYVEAKRGSVKKKSFALSIDTEKTSNVQLIFTAGKHSGRLSVKVNDEDVYNGDASGTVIIRLDKLQADNVFEFSVDEVGFQFWKTNYYEIGDVKVTGTLKVLENLESKQVFIVSGEEAGNIDRANIIYFVECKPGNVGYLKVYLNDALISSVIPDCGSSAKFDIDPSLILKGSNSLRFSADKGTFLIDQISIRTKLTEPIEPVYFFEVNSTKFSWVSNNTFDAVLRMKFVDDGKDKRAELNINNRRTFMDAKKGTNFTKNIDSFIIEGSNFIRIVPETTLNIAEVSIRLE